MTGPADPVPSATPLREQITGLVLAGGRGRRMGGTDKGLVDWHGKPLVEHVVERLRPQVNALLISANRNLERYRAWAPVLEDPEPSAFAGPLTGILVALRTTTTDWLAVAPCDLPALPADAIAHLVACLRGARAAYAAPGGTGHSLVCLLHSSLAPDLAHHIGAGGARVGAWFAAIGARAAPFADTAAFVNINAAADMQGAGPR